MKNAISIDEMSVPSNTVADMTQQPVIQKAARKKSTAAKKSYNGSKDDEIQYGSVMANPLVSGNTFADAEVIPFGKRMSKKNVPIHSFISIEDALSSQQLLERFVKEVLVADVDYGFIQGYGKPSLLKSGAEKLCNFYRLIPRVEVTCRIDEFQLPFFSREVKVVLLDSVHESVRGEGVGSCNSKEGKYRREDPFTLQNTILKMAKKRALIDAVLNVSGLSSNFTQDIEDIVLMEGGIGESKPITMKQYQYLSNMIKSNGITRNQYFTILEERFQVESLKQLNSAQMSQLINLIKNKKKS